MPIFEYQFELPIFAPGDGVAVGLLSGQAALSYKRDGSWKLEAIRLDGQRPATEEEAAAHLLRWGYKRDYVSICFPLAPDHPVYPILKARLDNEESDAIQTAIDEQLEEDRAAEADDHADYVREHRMEA